ncbi:peptidoglycan-binding protein [Streptomyces sp. NPDC057099]|uniref:peptidoglycan-binding domain-containing protein n=1 Tax=Streptomyces sp. NPDC057099 TaxID=3346019 RepID=UPI0036410790
MRRAHAIAAAVLLSAGLAGGPAAAAPQIVPERSDRPERVVAQGPDDICDYTNRRPTLQQGSSGAVVQQAQCYLNEAVGAELDVDGDFGGQTRSAVTSFQQCAEIVVDGRVGAQTWSFLSFWANNPGRPFC